jgi:RNA recognition motif-containing protein
MRGSLPADSLSKNHGLESNLRMNIYVGNLAYSITDDDLREAFAAFGEVSRASVIMDRDTGRSKGFGFVEMPDNSQAEAAINGLNEKDLSGRPIRVNEAKPREDRPRRPRY